MGIVVTTARPMMGGYGPPLPLRRVLPLFWGLPAGYHLGRRQL